MRKIFDRDWVDAHIGSYNSMTNAGRDRLAAEMQSAVENHFSDYDEFSALHKADQAVIETLVGKIAELKIELVNARAELQVHTAIGSPEHYLEGLKKMHGIDSPSDWPPSTSATSEVKS
ncbi:hypothetical protein [Bifidobacterium sp.]|uniref:hypothetical protein n=1 Tax=Bifidobacterium sp. TaxID=41200 RepID=UPI0039EBF15A